MSSNGESAVIRRARDEDVDRILDLLAHYDRPSRAGGARLRVAGVGNVITAPDRRGRGHAGRLLEAMLEEIPAEGFAYSLLGAYRSVLYERYGWAPLDQEVVRATLPPQLAAPSRPLPTRTSPTLCASTTNGAARRSARPDTGDLS